MIVDTYKNDLIKAKEKMDMDDSERAARLIQQQIERATRTEKNVTETEFTELKRENEEEKGNMEIYHITYGAGVY